MGLPLRRFSSLVLLWLLVAAAGTGWIARQDLDERRNAFETDARIAHRLLSQRVVQHDAILATLGLLQPGGRDEAAPEQRLPAVYPQVLRVLRRDASDRWPAEQASALDGAEAVSRVARRAALAGVDFAAGHYTLVRAADPASFALRIDLAALVPTDEWPLPAGGPVRVQLEHEGQTLVLEPGHAERGGWQFGFRKHLAAESQPFDVVAAIRVGWRELPWAAMLAWVVGTAVLFSAAHLLTRQRAERHRAQELLRLGQVSRLNALGELAAGMAHEVNQPLTAMLASTQAAGRLLADSPPDIDAARGAITQAATQARRAADVVGRLRRTVERPELGARLQPMRLDGPLRSVIDLVEPECRRLGVTPSLVCDPPSLAVQAEPVAFEQIVHNLLTNALHALEQVPPAERRLALKAGIDGAQAVVAVRDSGSGIAPEALPRLFEPFFSTRPGGLGLGLSLCETLASGMGGALTGRNAPPRGAEFRLALPLAAAAVA